MMLLKQDAVRACFACRAMTRAPWFEPSVCGTCGLLSILIQHTLVHKVLVPGMIHDAVCDGRENVPSDRAQVVRSCGLLRRRRYAGETDEPQ